MTLRSIRDHSALKWLYPGMHIKRWLALLLFGVSLMGLGIAYVLKEAYLQAELPGIFYYLTLQFMPRWGRGLLFMSLSLSTVLIAIYKLNESLLFAFVRPDHRSETPGLAETIYNKRFLQRGPRIVAIGGGTGLSTLLRGLKGHTSNLTAIVTVADDGGSTGRLRQEFGVVAPGDLRQCIAALAEAEPLMSKLFQYRFTEGTGLEGHSFGNLFIVAMAEVTGNFETAIHEASRVLNVRGSILPSTLEDVTLSARTHEDEMVHGEHNITEHGARIRDLYLNPAHAEAHPDAVKAILDADLIVIGPGSLYTSVLPNLLVSGIQKALFQTSATKVFICNVATQHGETDNFSVGDHIETLERHTGRGILNVVLANNNIAPELPEAWHSTAVPITNDALRAFEGLRLVQADVVAEENRYRHDPEKLAATLMRLYDNRDILSIEQRRPTPEAPLVATR
ncbi:gluconeogenesis factor YvcK family protein [Candidatus Amarobacter glycogenicus]|uniref:gluconeogenesis factor YvcK family protein n=1 Tax=Candidatus Amarobacter glycogenicus TaxID=3140699 RepID=UPI002A0BAA0C|nr:YvcK family protein [Dehalococcoidia bacterium]